MARRRSILVLAIAWVTLAALLVLAGEVILRAPALLSLDRRITSYVVAHRTRSLTAGMKALTWAGSWLAAAGLSAVLVVLRRRQRLPIEVIWAVLVGWAGEVAAVTIAKNLVHRPRPPVAVRLTVAHGWSFPSGHTATAVVVFTAGALILRSFTARTVLRLLIWGVAWLFIAAVAFSRVELGVHWASDVVASVIWSTSWLAVLLIQGSDRSPRAGDAVSAPDRHVESSDPQREGMTWQPDG